jgi:hypothetical protein
MPEFINNLISDHVSWIIVGFSIAVFLTYGVMLPLMGGSGSFTQKSLAHHPKLQYFALAIASVGLGTVGFISRALGDARGWINTASAEMTGSAIGSAIPWLLSGVVVLVWLNVILPEGLEPTPNGVFQHYFMWASSVTIYPLMVAVFGQVSWLLFAGLLVIMWVINKKAAGAGAGAYAR